MALDMHMITSLLEIVMINVVLSGDNAVVIGLAAAGVDPAYRNKAIFIGIAAATLMRIGFALAATSLLDYTGVLLVGGLMLLWVTWKMWSELREQDMAEAAFAGGPGHGHPHGMPHKTMGQAVLQIIIADVSMSLDNVLAVAGASEHNNAALIFGLALSVVLMAVASAWIANLLNRYRWIAWVGLLIILYVALKMTYEGLDDVLGHTLPHLLIF